MGCGSSKNNNPDPVVVPTFRGPENDAPKPAPKEDTATTPQISKEERQAKTIEMREKMAQTLELLRAAQKENEKNLLDGKLDSPNLEKIVGVMPFIKMGAGIIAEAVIPPPGGHCVKVALDVAGQVMKELRSNQVMMGLAEKCVEHMMLAMDDDKIQALHGKDAAVKGAFTKYKDVIDDVQAFIHETAGKDTVWIARLLVLNKTQKKLAQYKEKLAEVSDMLQLSVDIGSYTFLAAADQAKNDAEKDTQDLLGKYPSCHTLEDLLTHPDASKDVAEIMGRNLSVFEEATLTAIGNVHLKHGAHNLIKNKSLRRFWADEFPNKEQVQWTNFWIAFPEKLREDQVAMVEHFRDAKRRAEFEYVADLDDPKTVDINEINAVFRDDETSLHEMIKQKIAAYMENQGAVNQIQDKHILEGIAVERPQQQELMSAMQKKRLVVVQGLPGRGKFIAICQAARALFKPVKTDDPTSVRGYFQAIYTANLSQCKSKDDLDSRLRDCFEKIPRMGSTSDQIQAALNVLHGMDEPERPYKVLLILKNVEEVPNDMLDDFCRKLSSMLFREDKTPTNFSVVLSSRTEQSRLARNQKYKQLKDEHADFYLSPLPRKLAAEIFLAECYIKNNFEEKVDVSLEDAMKIADATGCNPKLLTVLAKSLEDELAFKMALKAPMKDSSVEEAFRDALLGCFKKLKDTLPVLLFVVDMFPGNPFSEDMLCEILAGFYRFSSLKDLQSSMLMNLQSSVRKDVRAMLALNLISKTGSTKSYEVVPVVRNYAKHLMTHPPQDELVSHIKMAVEARPMVLQKFTSHVVDLMESAFEQSMHAYKCAFPLMTTNKPHVQHALKLVTEVECLYKDNAEVMKVLRMLSIMVYDKSLYDAELVQSICLKLAKQNPDNQQVVGICLSTASAFFTGGKDRQHGLEISLKRAEEALEILQKEGDEEATYARIVALRSKGLILRELYMDLDVAVSCHKNALELLKLLGEARRSRLETALNLAEMSGTLDYEGHYTAGIQAGKEAIKVAEELFVEQAENTPAKHPTTALAYGSLGYNLLNNRDAEEAFKAHQTAYDMRLHVCGEKSQETAMSIQQLGLCHQELSQLEAAEASLLKSLEIREQLVKTDDSKALIANSLEQLANLYKESGKKEQAISHYRRTLDVRLQIFKVTNPKVQRACQDLMGLLNEEGRDEEVAECHQMLEKAHQASLTRAQREGA